MKTMETIPTKAVIDGDFCRFIVVKFTIKQLHNGRLERFYADILERIDLFAKQVIVITPQI